MNNDLNLNSQFIIQYSEKELWKIFINHLIKCIYL